MSSSYKRADDRTRPNLQPYPGLLLALYLFEAAGLFLAIGLYKYVDRLTGLTIRQMIYLIAPMGVLLVSGSYVVHVYRTCKRTDRRQFGLTAATNLVAVVALLVVGEIVVRQFSVRTPLGLAVAGTLLLPKDWDDVVARNRESLKLEKTYWISDNLLGWTVGPSRRSENGLYLSNGEGLRSQRSDVTYATHPAPNRIAIVGDSFTFGLEGPFEDSWGYQLERSLGPQYAVLNFGVDGYGVDQAYLRYYRDARPFHPAITILGFIEHDLVRTMAVYTFISFEWNFPFSKPRFVFEGGKLELLNTPLISPSQILSRQSVTELPYIEYDPGYHPIEWQKRVYHGSRLVRLLLSRFPRYPLLRADLGDEAVIHTNTELLLNFVRLASSEGTRSLVVYFPSRGDFQGQSRFLKGRVLSALRESGVNSLDLTSCVRQAGPEGAFIAGGGHYSAAGNAAVARCLLPMMSRLGRDSGALPLP